jgi:hypothetical protein
MIKLSGFSLVLGLLAVGALGCGSKPPPPAAQPTTKSAVDTKNVAPGTEDDLDADGVPNTEDKCPDKKEDGLAPNPKDGCPKS